MLLGRYIEVWNNMAMDFEWVAIALGDVTWITLAFIFGFLARQVNLPPLVGFLATGFALNYMGFSSGEMLQKLADLGITLLLFTVGLKLNLKILIKPHVWAVTALHTSIIIIVFGCLIFLLALLHAPVFSGLDLKVSFMLAFALSFSSTVFVVKSLEDKGEMKSLHGRIAISILVMQDLAAVVFLAVSAGKIPSAWALLLFLLIPARPLLHKLLQKTGHGELLILYGLVLAIGGAEIFELTGIKDDLGSLIMGVLISSHPKSKELAKTLLGFKDLFLVGFFLSIGLSGQLSIETLIISLLLIPFISFKSGVFYLLMTRFKLRARTALLATINLTNYSEFGLIVAAIGVSNGWLGSEWLVIIALALSFSYIIAAPLSDNENNIYRSYRPFWHKFESQKRLEGDKALDTLDATIAIFGMGRVGQGAYNRMRELHGEKVVGFDFDADLVKEYQSRNCQVFHGDPGDADFWTKIKSGHQIQIIMLALPNINANLAALEQLKEISYTGQISATARFPDEEVLLKDAGVTDVYNFYVEAGTGFANYLDAKQRFDGTNSS